MKTQSILALLLLVAACQAPSPENPQKPENPSSSGLLVLNNGKWGGNDASLCFYSTKEQTLTPNVFAAANGSKLGDLAQDMLLLGDELYIAMNGSQLIYVCDKNYKLIDEIRAYSGDAALSPRCLMYAFDKLYVTYYEGFLGEINPLDRSVRLCRVGPNPEGLCTAAGKIYVANSGAYLENFGNTVSVVDPKSFEQESVIEVNRNPIAVCADSAGKWLYILSYGNYSEIPSMLQVYELSSSRLSNCPYQNVNSIAMGPSDTLYLVSASYKENWQLSGTIFRHDASSNRTLGQFSEQIFSPYYSISVDSVSGELYIGCSDYTTNGDVYVLSSKGEQLYMFDTEGLNPQKVIKLND